MAEKLLVGINNIYIINFVLSLLLFVTLLLLSSFFFKVEVYPVQSLDVGTHHLLRISTNHLFLDAPARDFLIEIKKNIKAPSRFSRKRRKIKKKDKCIAHPQSSAHKFSFSVQCVGCKEMLRITLFFALSK